MTTSFAEPLKVDRWTVHLPEKSSLPLLAAGLFGMASAALACALTVTPRDARPSLFLLTAVLAFAAAHVALRWATRAHYAVAHSIEKNTGLALLGDRPVRPSKNTRVLVTDSSGRRQRVYLTVEDRRERGRCYDVTVSNRMI